MTTLPSLETTPIPGLVVVRLDRRDDARGFFKENWQREKMLAVGLHCRIAGRPARTAALARFLDHVLAHERVWVARRVDIARHWAARFPYPG